MFVIVKTGEPDHPTGYSATALPLFEKLSADEFEQFCTELLNFNPVIYREQNGMVVGLRIVDASRLGSGTAQGGADICAKDDHGGVWYFQCKRKKEFHASDVLAAVALAEENLPHADHYVLVTTCGLSQKAQLKMGPKWSWWNASQVTTEVQKLSPIERGMTLVHRFFGRAWTKTLFPWGSQPWQTTEEFFDLNSGPGHRLDRHTKQFIQRGDALKNLESFCRDGAGRALIVSAAGGQGKSRLLIELAHRLSPTNHSGGAPRVRFLNARQVLTPDQADLLAREKDLVLVIDDAHRQVALVSEVARITAKGESIHLIVVTRPQAVDVLQSELFSHYFGKLVEPPLVLPAWSQAEIFRLAQQSLDPQHQLQAPQLAELSDYCPILVVMGGAQINTDKGLEEMKDSATFRERVFRSFSHDFLDSQPSNRRERLDRLIKFLSFVSPTPKNDNLSDRAASILGCSELDVKEDIALLLASGLAVENREGIRLYPDLFADAVLLDACLDSARRPSAMHQEIIRKLPVGDFPALMLNLAQADWEARTRKGSLGSLFDPIWKEFKRRFDEASWGDGDSEVSQFMVALFDAQARREQRVDRSAMLRQWASFAIFLPERTIELAELSIASVKALLAEQPDQPTSAYPWARMCAAVPLLLKPIISSHSDEYANRALNILWSLDAEEPLQEWQRESNAIAVIADAACFGIYRPQNVQSRVLDWFFQKASEVATLERLRQQPWILNALLKPFFARDLEHVSSDGLQITLSELNIDPEKTRGLRQKALELAKRFLCLSDVRLANAVIPTIQQAIRPLVAHFGKVVTLAEQAGWRGERLAALEIVKLAALQHAGSPSILFRLRRILLHGLEYDPDEVVRGERRRILHGMPDTFEARLTRVLTSFAHDELKLKNGPDSEPDFDGAEIEWTRLLKSTGQEVVERFKTVREFCEFLRKLISDLVTDKSPGNGWELFASVLEASPSWSAPLLDQIMNASDLALDRFISVVLHHAAILAPDAYRSAIELLPARGRSNLVCSLVNRFGWRQLHGGGLDSLERQSLLAITSRIEVEVVDALISVAGLHLSGDPELALDVLCRLRPSSEQGYLQLLSALAQLATKHQQGLDAEKVVRCLESVVEHSFNARSEKHDLEVIGASFPKQVYQHLRQRYQRAEREPKRQGIHGVESFSLGPIDESDFMEQEIRGLWLEAVGAARHSFSQDYRLTLIRSLLFSRPSTSTARIQNLVAECHTPGELVLAARLSSYHNCRFVFEQPELVRAMLTRAEELDAAKDVHETLLLSVIGRGRSFGPAGTDPESRYVLERYDATANRFRDDPVLGDFYRAVSESESEHLQAMPQVARE